MFVKIKVFLKAKDTHCAKSSFPTFFPLLINVHTSLQILKEILTNLKHIILSNCNPWFVCYDRVVKFNPNPLVLCTMFMATWELWPLRISKWWFIVKILLLCVWTKGMMCEIHLSNKMVVIQALGYTVI